MKATSLFAAVALFAGAAGAGYAQPLFNGTFDSNADLWSASPFGTTDNTIAWNDDHDNTGNDGGSLAVTVTNENNDNSAVSSAIDGAVQFNGLTTENSPPQFYFTAYVFVDDPLVENPDITSGNGGAALALIDGAVDFTGVITDDADRILDNSEFEQISTPVLEIQGGGRSYNTYLLIRNATGTAYFDDLAFEEVTSVEDWDIY